MPRRRIALAAACALTVAGEAAGFALGEVACVWPAVACAAIALGCAFLHRPRLLAIPLFLIAMCIAMRAEYTRRSALVEVGLSPGPFESVLTVESEPRIRSLANDASSVSFMSSFAGGRIMVIARFPPGERIPIAGECWDCAGWLERKDVSDTRIRKLWIKGRRSRAVRVEGSGSTVLTMLYSVRRSLSRRIAIGLEDCSLEAGLLRAMVLGDRGSMGRDQREDFVRSGTVHVFAISGLHVMVVASVVTYVLMILGLPVRMMGLATIPVLWAYVGMIGYPPSAVRAATMASIGSLATLFWRRSDLLSAWEWTLLLFAVFDPIGLFGIGSMLSFAVMLGIILFLRFERQERSAAFETLGMPLVAWAAGVPLIAHSFGQISFGGIFANLAMVPLATLTVGSSVIGMLTSFVSEWLAMHFNSLAALLVRGMVWVSHVVASIPYASFQIERWSLAQCLSCYVAFVLVFVQIWLRRSSRRMTW